MRILIRTDGGNVPEIGTGHISRTLLLANYLKKSFYFKTSDITFVSQGRKEFEFGREKIKSKGFKVHTISKESNNNEFELSEILELEFELIIFDKLSIKPKIVKLLKSNKKKVIIFDETGSSAKYADLTINALLDTKFKSEKVLSGYKYFIAGVFKKTRIRKKENKIAKNIFICFGGYDHNSFTIKLLNKLKKHDLGLNFYIVIRKNIEEIKKLIYKNNKQKSNYHLYISPPNFDSILSKSDLAIVSGGLTLFDCVKNQIPSISIPQYDHQKHNIRNISELGATIYKEIKSNEGINDLIDTIESLCKNQKIREDLKKNTSKIIDNQGLKRVVNEIEKII